MGDRYELVQPTAYDNKARLMVEDGSAILLPNSMRRCTDCLCTIIFALFFLAFWALLIYSIISGSYLSVVSIYNGDATRCNTQPEFTYGYITDLNNMNKAVCVKECPTKAGSLTECLIDGVVCDLAVFKPSYASFAIDSYCVPSNISNINIESLFSPGTYESWLYDMQTAWVVLALAAGGAILLSLLFFVFVRCCAGFVIWTTTICAIAAMLTLGVFFILTAQGVVIDDYVSDNLSDLSHDTLLATGIVSIIGAILLFLLVCCLHSRLQTGIKAVELGSIFLFDNCCMVMLPVTQVIFILGSIVALIYGAGCLYSLGTFSFPNKAAFPVIDIDDWQITMLSVYFAAAVWMIFFFHGCNHYMLCSSVAIWYFDGTNGMENAPCGQSIHRLAAYNIGSVAITALVNGLLFIVKLIAHIFSFDDTESDNCMVSCCLKCLGALFCIFKQCLRFLNDGAYVQMAIEGNGYCHSSVRAFDLIMDNAAKVGITDGIAIFFTIIGVIGVSAAVAVGAYFAVLKVPYYKERISSPFAVTFISGVIAFVVACVYLSMIDISATAMLQCFLTDRDRNNGRAKYARESVKAVIDSS